MAQNTPRKQTSATISNTGANLTGVDPEGQGYVAGSFPHFLFFRNDLAGRANLRNCRPLIALRDDKRLLQLQRKLAKVKLLTIDELGFVPLNKTGAELLFELISQRYERDSTLITSNLPFEEWTEGQCALQRACYLRAARSKAQGTKWPTFAPPLRQNFTPPWTLYIK